jgi:uracil-DNA glycosylase
MAEARAATRTRSSRPSLSAVRREAAGCRACGLWKQATQTVFGAGPRSADLMLVGEQPGDREDIDGKPFVGPAGRVLDAALEEAEIERDDVYLTNVVKHFKWRQGRGRRRLHQRPDAAEVAACRPWLDAELEAVHPEVVVCLGATAARALLGRGYSVTKDHGELIEVDFAPRATLTAHPSSILRIPEREDRRLARRELASDLAAAAAEARRLSGSG